MKIAVASGKGGTGKTTVATNLARIIPGPVAFLDCDVEEPNAHLFLKPEMERAENVSVPVPRVDAEKCDLCGKCGEICRFSAITKAGNKVLTFPDLCHGCGGCAMVCPTGAITEVPRVVGVVEHGKAGDIIFRQGRLRIGEAMSPPLIKQVRSYTAGGGGVTIIDAPPGSSCPVIEAVEDADLVLLVTEPTPFGLNDLEIAVETMRAIGLEHGIVINRAGSGDDRVYRYAKRAGVPLFAEIPDVRAAAEAYSRGEMLVDAVPGMREAFMDLWLTIRKRASQAA
ncbi:MAG: ATP-binding protein [Desulfatibacillaceae bacterium]